MNMHILFCAVGCLALVTASAVEEDSRRVFEGRTPEEAIQKFLDSVKEEQNATGGADYAAACMTVVRSVRRNTVLIFASAATARTGTFRDGDLTVEVIWDKTIAEADSRATGAFYQHSNKVVLSYAVWQCVSGNRDLGLQLIRRLVDAQPTLSWSSPTHMPIQIQSILSGIEKNDGSMDSFLKEDSAWWLSRLKEFGR